MYVKALLKIFEYATNIKDEKLNDCEELLEDVNIKTELEKRKELARLKRLRKESFMLSPPSSQTLNRNDDKLLKELDEIDRENNNYLEYKQNVDVKENNVQNRVHTLSENSVRPRTISDIKRDFQLGDIMEFVHEGLETIVDDQVTKRFTTEELTVWNLLSRTNQQYEYISFRVTVLWALGLMLRYCLLFPFRLVLFILACFYTFISTCIIGKINNQRLRKLLNWYGSVMLHRILSRVFSAIITFHNKEHRAKPGSICVANHTSPIDVIILSTDNVYSMIGQKHGGFTGMMQRAFSRASKHIWFDRSESKDRGLVARRMREHIEEKTNQPILIFPEGTCINNTSVMMFKKGCFEIDAPIYPVAIKYDLRFGDAFWNSNKHSMLQYLLLMMTSWAIVVDVYYLPPMEKRENESAANFASRVKSEIVKKGSFADLNWDGMLKRTSPKLDLMYQQQQKYVSQLKIE
jgi:glycerol-3-phosphate O-acyltransferase 3/4